MTILNRSLWMGLLIPIAMTVAGVVGGIEWVFASLGAMVLIGMAGIGIYILARALRHSDTSLKGVCTECDSTSAVSFDGDDLKQVTHSKPAEAIPISKQDKRLIMEHVDEFFANSREQSQEKPAEALSISEQDKRLLMEYVNDLFVKGLRQSEEKPS